MSVHHLLTHCYMNVFDDGFQVFLQSSQLQLLQLHGGVRGQLPLQAAAGPVQLGHKPLQILKRVLLLHLRIFILLLLIVGGEVMRVRR